MWRIFMNIETRATAKRIMTLLSSIGTIACYGYALGCVGGYLAGQGRPFAAAAGIISGSLLAFAAIKIWRSYIADLELIQSMTDSPEPPEPPEPPENGPEDAL
jgi:hypothetical protein